MGWPQNNDTMPTPAATPAGGIGYSPLVKLAMRMGWFESMSYSANGNHHPAVPWKYIDAVKIDSPAPRAYVFLVRQSGEAMTFEDDYHLFPSDTLIAKLKMLGS